MSTSLDSALDQSLDLLRRGRSVDSCLDEFPEHAGELRSLLALALDVAIATPPGAASEARAAGERRMLEALAQKHQAQAHPVARGIRRLFVLPRRRSRRSLGSAWQAAVLAVVILLVGAAGLALAASAQSLPGDALYTVKLARQRAQLALALGPAQHQLLAEQFKTQRRLDVEAALKGGRQGIVEFEGTLDEQEADFWIVGGLVVTLQPVTEIEGEPVPGVVVRVRGFMSGDGLILALALQADPSDQPWLLDTPEATRTPTPAEPQEGTDPPEPSASPSASSGDAASETPRPTDTSQPTPTAATPATAEPSETPAPTASPTATSEPEPSFTPTLAATTEPGSSPEPTESEEPTRVPEPTQTSTPTGEPEPTATVEPSEEPDETDEPEEPDETDEPEEPEPTEESEPGDGP